MIDFGLYVMYAFLVGAVVLAIALSLVNTFKTPGGLMKAVYGIGGLVVVFGICYALSGSEVTPTQAALGITESSAKLVGAGLLMLYVVMVLAIIGLVYSEINKAIK